MHRERNDLLNAADPVAPSKNMFWDFISFEDDAETAFYNTRVKNHGGLQKMAPRRRRSYIFNSQPKRVDTVDSEAEEEFKKTLKKDSRKNLSPKSPINSAKYRTSKDDVVKEKFRILRLNTPNAISSRSQSTRASIEQISNMYPAEKSKNYKENFL